MLLSLAYCIPFDWMQANLEESATQLSSEGEYPAHYASLGETKYDNFTTAIMLNEAAHCGGNPLVESLSNPLSELDDDKLGALGAYVRNPADDALRSGSYPRYWHGYLLVLKPLLIALDLREIRVLFQAAFFALLAAVVVGLVRRCDTLGAVASIVLCTTFGLFGAADAAATLPLFFSFALSVAGMLWVLSARCCSLAGVSCRFLVLGALTVYFDFLDNPLLTWGLPAAVLVICAVADWRAPAGSSGLELTRPVRGDYATAGVSKVASLLVVSALAWIVGYGGFWAVKWALAAAVTGTDVVALALDKIVVRSGYGEVSPLDAVWQNLLMMGKARYVIIALFAACTFLVVVVFCAHKRATSCGEGSSLGSFLVLSVALLVISASPYVWYAVLSEHSAVHDDIIAYRTQLIAFFCLSVVLVQGIVMIADRLRRGRHCLGQYG